jgi:hypothetical protein
MIRVPGAEQPGWFPRGLSALLWVRVAELQQPQKLSAERLALVFYDVVDGVAAANVPSAKTLHKLPTRLDLIGTCTWPQLPFPAPTNPAALRMSSGRLPIPCAILTMINH